jgi:hypothetical protein
MQKLRNDNAMGRDWLEKKGWRPKAAVGTAWYTGKSFSLLEEE